MFTTEEKLSQLRKIDKPSAIWLWHEETLAKLQARILDFKKGEMNMDKQIDEIQESIVNVLGEIEVLVIEDKKEKALELLRRTKKELVDDYQSVN